MKEYPNRAGSVKHMPAAPIAGYSKEVIIVAPDNSRGMYLRFRDGERYAKILNLRFIDSTQLTGDYSLQLLLFQYVIQKQKGVGLSLLPK
ncbi:hypothetical protein ACFL4W_04400 [Planctomycetota bacterium]